MGKRGPPPKPTALKKLEGTYRKDRAARNEVVAPVGSPSMPKGMPAEAAARWKVLVGLLIERGTLATEDGAVLEAHCRAYATWRKFQALAERVPLINHPQHGLRVNPAAAEARQWEARLTTTGDRLGLNASARSRVGAAEAPKERDHTEEFLFTPPRLVKAPV